MPGSHVQNPGSSIQEEVTERGVQKFQLRKAADYNAITCQEAISKILAPAYKKKWRREESENFSFEKKQSPRHGGERCENKAKAISAKILDLNLKN